jgi:DNA-binding IclR family transcriptional regulator
MRHEPGKSAIRALEFLAYFDELRHPLRLRDFCAQFNYPVSSTEELLKTLVRHGHLTFDPAARTYLPALKVAAMSAWLPDLLFDDGRLVAAAEDLQERTGENVFVTSVNDLHCELIYARSNASRPARLPAGASCPLVLSALGRLWLSRYPDDVIERVYRRSAAAKLFARNTLPLPAFMEDVRPLRGVEVACLEGIWPLSTRRKPTTVFATDVPTHRAQQRLVLAVGGPAERVAPKVGLIRDAISEWRTTFQKPTPSQPASHSRGHQRRAIKTHSMTQQETIEGGET